MAKLLSAGGRRFGAPVVQLSAPARAMRTVRCHSEPDSGAAGGAQIEAIPDREISKPLPPAVQVMPLVEDEQTNGPSAIFWP